ncbi:hypothetical protein FQA39_LY14496 [Lamprigera yunnana]|nr:hypothetical protein FQA39_LY14496 [Lamprigera yunnana]
MPRSVASVKKQNKAAKARKSFWKRRKVIDLIETTADNVPEIAHVEYFNKYYILSHDSLPTEELPELHVERSIVLSSNLHGNRLVEIAYFVEQSRRLGIHDAKWINMSHSQPKRVRPSDPNFEWFNAESEGDDDPADSDADAICSEHSSDSEVSSLSSQDEDDQDETFGGNDSNFYYNKRKGFKWSKTQIR